MESQTTPVRANPDFQWYPFSVSHLATLSVQDRKKYVSNLSKSWTEYKDAYYKHHKDIEPNEWEVLLQFYQKFQQWNSKTTETTQLNDSKEDVEEQSESSKYLERNDTVILQWNTQPTPAKTKTLSFSTESSVPEEFYVQANESNDNNENKKTEVPKATFFVPDSQSLDGEEQMPTTKQLPDIPEIPNSVTEISTQTEDQNEDLSGHEEVDVEEEALKETQQARKIELDNASQMNRQATTPLNLEDLEDGIPENEKPSTPLPSSNGTPTSQKDSASQSKSQQPHRRVSSVIRALENDAVIKNKLPQTIAQPSPRKRGRPSKAEIARRKELEMMQKQLQKGAAANQNKTAMDVEKQSPTKNKPELPTKSPSPSKNGSPTKNASPAKNITPAKEYYEEEPLVSPNQKSPHKTRQELLGEIEAMWKEGLLSPKKARVS